MPVHSVERKLAAIFAADIAGYSRLMVERDEVGTLARFKACRVVIDELIASHRGRIFNTAGDGVVADFTSARISDHPARRITELLTWNWQRCRCSSRRRLARRLHRALAPRRHSSNAFSDTAILECREIKCRHG